MSRALSGVKPSGKPHLGNYLGAMRQHVEFQTKHEQNFYFIADAHALTTVKDTDTLRENIVSVVLDYLALGIDPERTVFYRQSDITEHFELNWILACLTPFGLMERAHAWKDAIQKGGRDQNVGLFTYPILMAADILLYSPDVVPVGKDQKQHVEIARELAGKFNSTYGETFKLPQEYTPKEIASIVGTDGEHKMSKSYNNTIEIFADEGKLKKQVMSIVTDSTPLEEPKDPDKCAVFNIYKHFGTADEIANLRDKYITGGFGYGDAKKTLLIKLIEYFAPYREKRAQLAKDQKTITDILDAGANKARPIAQKKLAEVKKRVGLAM